MDAFRAYVRSDDFAEAFVRVGPAMRQILLRVHSEYAHMCEGNTAHPLPKPQRTTKSRWVTDVGRAELAKAYARAGDDHERAGRLLGCTAGAARLARKRYLAPSGVCLAASGRMAAPSRVQL